MRVLMVTPWYPDDNAPHGGVFIKNQCRALAVNHDVTVISAKVDYKQFGLCSYSVKSSGDSSLREYRLVIKRSLPLYNQLNHLMVTIVLALRIAKEFKPDVIHCCIGFPGAIIGAILSWLCKKPFVFTEHTRIRNNFRSFFHKRCTLFGLKKAKILTAVSRMLANELKDVTGKPVVVIPNIVDVERFKNVKPPSTAVPQLGFLGGLNSPVKGLDLLLQAVSQIQGDFVLHIGGTGAFESAYRTQAVELGIALKCKFYGFIQPDELPVFMSSLHFLICASRYETFCVALIEAMACGLPVVSTKCGGPEDFVDSRNGILCAKEDVQSLRDAIQQMLSSYRQYSSEVIRQSVEKFTPAVVGKKLVEVYTDATTAS